jgi:hypothetical protein
MPKEGDHPHPTILRELGEFEIGTMLAQPPLSFTHWIGKRSTDVWGHVF